MSQTPCKLHPAKLISYFPVTIDCDLCPPSFLPAAAMSPVAPWRSQAWQLRKPDVRVYKESFQQWQLLGRSHSPKGLCLALTVYLLVAMAGLPKSRMWDQLPVGNSSFFSWKAISTGLQLWENVHSFFSRSQKEFMFSLYKTEILRKVMFHNF